ncbi:conserved hypothetical protein [Rhodobacter sphaeroides ATCC 17029]|nr:conserved hypothetical protein [Cereibacter sphaeroides ATCC 17029]
MKTVRRPGVRRPIRSSEHGNDGKGMDPASAHTTAEAPGATAASACRSGTPDFGQQSFPREGAAPLRASCRPVSRRSAPVPGQPDLFIDLWLRRRGGFVIAHSLLGGCGTGKTATGAGDLEEAMSVIEAYCRTLSTAPAGHPPGPKACASDLAEAIIELARFRDRQRIFLGLAGEALDDWQACPACRPHAPS